MEDNYGLDTSLFPSDYSTAPTITAADLATTTDSGGYSPDTSPAYTSVYDNSGGSSNSTGGFLSGIGSFLQGLSPVASSGLGLYGQIVTAGNVTDVQKAQLAAATAAANAKTAGSNAWASYLPLIIGGGLLVVLVFLFRSMRSAK